MSNAGPDAGEAHWITTICRPEWPDVADASLVGAISTSSTLASARRAHRSASAQAKLPHAGELGAIYAPAYSTASCVANSTSLAGTIGAILSEVPPGSA